MKLDDTIKMVNSMKDMMPSRIRASVETKDIGIAGGLFFIGLMIAVALFFS